MVELQNSTSNGNPHKSPPCSPSFTSTPTKKIRVENITNARSCENHRDDDTTTMSLVEEEDDPQEVESTVVEMKRMISEHRENRIHNRGEDADGDGDVDMDESDDEDGGKDTDEKEEVQRIKNNDDLPLDPKEKSHALNSNIHSEGSQGRDTIPGRSSRSPGSVIDNSHKTNSHSHSGITVTAGNTESEKPPPKKSVSKKLNYIPSKLGRKGDPRMHRALKARLDNPKLSLMDALTQGGFEFHWKGGISYDSDNVQLGQRKNQLSRRLRLYKQNQNHNKVEELEKRVNLCSNGVNPLLRQNKHGSLKDHREDTNDNDSRKRKNPEDANSVNDTYHPSQPQASFFPYKNTMGNNKNNYSEIMKMMMSQMAGTPQCTYQPNNFDQSSFRYQNRHDFYNAMRGGQGNGNSSSAMEHQQQINPFMPFMNNPMMNAAQNFNKSPASTEGSIGSTRTSTAPPSAPLSTRDLFDYQQKINQISINTNNTFPPQLQSDKIQKLHDALNQYRFDSSALMKRCMLSAGFTHQETEECDEMYLLFGDLAVEDEKKRIGRIRSRMGGSNRHHHNKQEQSVMMPSPSPMTMGSGRMEAMLEMMNRMRNEGNFGSTDITSNNADAVLAKRSSSSNGNDNDNDKTNDGHPSSTSCHSNDSASSSSSHSNNTLNASKSDVGAQKSSLYQDHASSSSQQPNNTNNNQGVTNKESGESSVSQHPHQLEGRSGHRAIIHKPADGNPHIDLVVDGKIKCYEHCQPLLTDSTAVWFSKYKFDKNHNGNCTGHDHSHNNDDCTVHDHNSLIGLEPNSSKPEDKVPESIQNLATNDGIVGPKIIDFNELNLDSDEWKHLYDEENNINNPFVEEEVLGSFFQLGEKK